MSIIICAQNEKNNLLHLLPLIFEQDYPEFEVIVVDDGSTDDTIFILQDMAKVNSRLHLIELNESVKNKQGKKFALMMGLKGAKFDHVLLTDADCIPNSNQWIKLMQGGFNVKKEIVLGYSPYEKHANFLNLFIRFETFMTANNYISYALAGLPYMGVGRNLAYHKHLFFDNKGFASHIHLMSGDDDLFINQVANSENTAIVVDSDAFTISHPKLTWGDYFHQKFRHLSVGKYYKSTHKNLLAFQVIFTVLLWISFFSLIAIKFLFIYVLGLFLTYQATLWIILYINSRKLKDPTLGLISPLFYLFYHIYLMGMSFSGLFYKAKSWK